MRLLARLLVRLYQVAFSPFLGGQCRFHPTCSAYALQAIDLHGGARGLFLAVGRVARCHPLHAGGVDPVPPPSALPAQVASPVASRGES